MSFFNSYFQKPFVQMFSRKVTQGFTLASCLTVALQPMMVQLAYAQEIVIDPNGNVGFQPSLQSSIRPQVVDIARPNSGGVSHNQYQRFDVTSQGVVLNNSQGAVNSQIAGTISGNSNLENGTASTIVNEVTSTRRSTLEGAIEVAGDRAGVIIANPNGITCNGCNFINASNGTLTTGVPTISGGTVRLDVTSGGITIGRAGLNGSGNGVSNINLIGRTVVIDGRVTAIDGINVQGGAQGYDLTRQRRVSSLTGRGAAPDLVVDGTEYGAMEAGRIQIIGNESGLGVRTLGAVQAHTNDAKIVSTGDLTVRSVTAQERVELRSTNGDLTIERDVASIGGDVVVAAQYDFVASDRAGLYGQTGVSVSSGKTTLSFYGDIQSGADVDLNSKRALIFSGYGNAVGTFNVRSRSSGITLNGATVVANRFLKGAGGTTFSIGDTAIFTSGDINIAATDFHFGANVVIDGLTEDDVSNLVVAATRNFHNSADLRRHSSATISYAGNLYNEVGGVIEGDDLRIAFDKEIHNSGVIHGVDSLEFDVAALFNNETGIILSDDIEITTSGLLSNGGTISSSGTLELVSSEDILNEGYLQASRAYLTAPDIVIGGGAELRTELSSEINADTKFSNRGILASLGSLKIDSGRFENNGLISVESELTAIADTITNTDAITAGYRITLTSTDDLENSGTLASYAYLNLNSNTLVENQGTILADRLLGITTPFFDNRSDAFVRSQGVRFNGSRIRNYGSLFSSGDLSLRNNIDLLENYGVLAAQRRLELKGRDENSRAVFGSGSVTIAGLQPDDESQTLLSSSSATIAFDDIRFDGRISAGGTASLTTPGLLTINGVLDARRSLTLAGDSVYVTNRGQVISEGGGNIRANGRLSNRGIVSLGGYLQLSTPLTDFTNEGTISAQGTKRFAIAGDFTNSGVFQSSGTLSIAARNIDNRGYLQASDYIGLSARVASEDADGNRIYLLGRLSNSGTIASESKVSLVGGSVSQSSGAFLAASQLRVTATSFNFKGNAVLDGDARNDWRITEKYLQYGTLYSQGALRISADSMSTYAGSLLGSADQISLSSAKAAGLHGSITARTVTAAATGISGANTSSIFASENLFLNASTGRVSHSGELIAGDQLVINGNEFDIRGNAFASHVSINTRSRGYTRGKIFGSETLKINTGSGGFYNYGLLEARREIEIDSGAIVNNDNARIASTRLDLFASGSISNAGTLYGASDILIRAKSGITNQDTGTINAVSLGIKALNLTNRGTINVYGLFGDIDNSSTNYGSIRAETYFGLDTKYLYNRANASIASGDHVYARASASINNEAGAEISGTAVDLRALSIYNSGAIKASDVANIVVNKSTFENRASGTIYAPTIAVISRYRTNNFGVIGQTTNSSLPVTETLNISSGSSVNNEGQLAARNIQLIANGSVTTSGSIEANDGFLGLKSAGSIANTGTLRAANLVVESGSTFDNQSLIRATNAVYVSAGGDIRNRDLNGSSADIAAQNIVLSAGKAVSNSGRLFGYSSLAVEAGSRSINNSGQITGPDITLIANNAGVYSTSGIYAGGTLAIRANTIGLRGRVRVSDQVSLVANRYNISVDEQIETRRLLVNAGRDIEARSGSFRGTELTQLIADDIIRTDTASGSEESYRKLPVIADARGDVFVQLRDGGFGKVGGSIYNTTGHTFDRANFDVSGSVSLITDEGDVFLSGNISADDDVYVRSGRDAVLGSGSIDARDVLHIEAGRLLKNYGNADVGAGNKVQLLQSAGWFYTANWFDGDLGHDLSVQAKTIVVNSSHRLVGKNIYLSATDDIKQKDQVISARKITYSAGRDLVVRFNPFTWRANNPSASYTGTYWDVASAGLRGHTLLSQGQGTTLYAGQDIKLQSGKIHTGGDLNIVASRNITSEPVYLETDRTNRPGDVCWAFSDKYTGVVSGHNASQVDIFELRAYENQLSATGNINILAGGSANFIGTQLTASNGDIAIEALNGGVNMVAAPGFWNYNYRNTTVRKKFFGLYRRTTTYEFDAAEDIYKRTQLRASNGNIHIRATGDNGDYASILSAGTGFTARNIYLNTPNGNISAGTYAERSVTREETHSSGRLFGFIPFGSSDSEEVNSILINYGNDFLADELLDIAAPQGTLSITGGSIRAQTVNLTAARLEINAAINSARNTYYSRKDNMITITTIQSGSDQETAHLPEINAPEINFNISGETHIQGYAGATLNSQLVNLIGTHQFDNATLGLASASDQADAEEAAEEINRDYLRTYDLPGASDGQQFAYLDTLIQDYGATYHTIELRDRQWYDKQVQLNPAFKALLQAVATYITGGLNLGIENALIAKGVDAATTNLIVGVVEGTITGELDLDQVLRGAVLAGVSSTITSYLGDNINLGAGLGDQSPFANDLKGNFAPSAIVDRLGDRVISQVVSNVVHGQDPFAGFDQLGRTFLVSETLALAQFGIGDLGQGSANWEGSVGHLLLHGGVGCVALEVMNGDCAAGFFAGASSSVLAGANLTDDQKLKLAPLAGAIAGYFASGGEAINVNFGGTVSQSAIINNYLTHEEALRRAQANARLARCEANSGECSQSEIDALVQEITELNQLDDNRDQALITACNANSQGSYCLSLINELAYATQLFNDPQDPFNIGSAVGNFVLDYRNAHLVANYGDPNGVSSAMLAEQASGQALLTRFQESFDIVRASRYEERLVLLSADALMGLAGAGLVRIRNGAIKSSMSNQRHTLPPATNITQEQWNASRQLGVDPRYVDSSGNPIYPTAQTSGFDDGFSRTPTTTTLRVNQTFDRFGGDYKEAGVFRDRGGFVAPVGTDFSQRSLPQSAANRPLVEYRVIKDITNVQTGTAAPWFGQPGGGVQHSLPHNIDYLKRNGYIVEIRRSE